MSRVQRLLQQLKSPRTAGSGAHELLRAVISSPAFTASVVDAGGLAAIAELLLTARAPDEVIDEVVMVIRRIITQLCQTEGYPVMMGAVAASGLVPALVHAAVERRGCRNGPAAPCCSTSAARTRG